MAVVVEIILYEGVGGSHQRTKVKMSVALFILNSGYTPYTGNYNLLCMIDD